MFVRIGAWPLVMIGAAFLAGAWLWGNPWGSAGAGSHPDAQRLFWMGLAITAAGLVPMLVLKRRDRTFAHRVRRGQCLECGYDLRATPGRCPEMFSPL